MSRPRAYRSIDEIMSIFKITLSTVNSIVKNSKIDSFSDKWKIQINSKDFYKAYTDGFNPSLFGVWDKKKQMRVAVIKPNNADIFQKLFGSPNKTNTKKKMVGISLMNAWDFVW